MRDLIILSVIIITVAGTLDILVIAAENIKNKK